MLPPSGIVPTGRLSSAKLPRRGTAVRKPAAGKRPRQRRDVAADYGERLTALVSRRQRVEKLERIWVPRSLKECLARSGLHNLAGIHHRNPVRHLGDDPKIVRNEQQGHPALALKLTQHVEHLGLNRHVERRRRLIRDEKRGVAGQRHRDHHPLLHPSRELERVLMAVPGRVRHMHDLEQLEYARLQSSPG